MAFPIYLSKWSFKKAVSQQKNKLRWSRKRSIKKKEPSTPSLLCTPASCFCQQKCCCCRPVIVLCTLASLQRAHRLPAPELGHFRARVMEVKAWRHTFSESASPDPGSSSLCFSQSWPAAEIGSLVVSQPLWSTLPCMSGT